MEVKIDIKHVNGLKNPKVVIEEGRIDYTLPFEVQLSPGDFERIIQLFRQRVPVMLTISSPQAKMDLFVETVHDPSHAPVTQEEADKLRQDAKDALRTSQIAYNRANDSSDAGDREVADTAADTAAKAVTRAAEAMDVPENVLLTTLGNEVHQQILEEGERQAENEAAEEGEKGKKTRSKKAA